MNSYFACRAYRFSLVAAFVLSLGSSGCTSQRDATRAPAKLRTGGPCQHERRPALCGFALVTPDQVSSSKLRPKIAVSRARSYLFAHYAAFLRYLRSHYPTQTRLDTWITWMFDTGVPVQFCTAWLSQPPTTFIERFDNDGVEHAKAVFTIDALITMANQPGPHRCGRFPPDEAKFVAANAERVFAKWSKDPENPPAPPPRRDLVLHPFVACPAPAMVVGDGLDTQKRASPTSFDSWDHDQLAEAARRFIGASPRDAVHVLAWSQVDRARASTDRAFAVVAPEAGSHRLWGLASLHRVHPNDAWNKAGNFNPSSGRGPIACIDHRPTANEIQLFLNNNRWPLASGQNYKVVAGGIRSEAWRQVIGQHPTIELKVDAPKPAPVR